VRLRFRRAALCVMFLTQAAAVAASAPEVDLSQCTVCHGAHGNGNLAIRAPKIAGMEAWYIRRQLEHFRKGLRGTQSGDQAGLEMRPVAVAITDRRSVDVVVSYVATFKPKPPPVTVTGNIERGRTLYEACSGCHGARAEGNAALQAPALASQTDWYLVTQLEHFRSGRRGFAPEDMPGTQMRAAAAILPDSTAVADVVAYINTLR
jgi:cytochrome c553